MQRRCQRVQPDASRLHRNHLHSCVGWIAWMLTPNCSAKIEGLNPRDRSNISAKYLQQKICNYRGPPPLIGASIIPNGPHPPFAKTGTGWARSVPEPSERSVTIPFQSRRTLLDLIFAAVQ